MYKTHNEHHYFPLNPKMEKHQTKKTHDTNKKDYETIRKIIKDQNNKINKKSLYKHKNSISIYIKLLKSSQTH